MNRIAAKRAASVLLLLALACMPIFTGCSHKASSGTATPSVSASAIGFEIYFMNVGKGDAALIALPGGKWAMVDTGPADSLPAVQSMLGVLGVKRLEAVFISHPHTDHAGGLDDVLSLAPCPIVYTTPVDYGKPTADMMNTAQSHAVPVKAMKPGQAVEIAGVTFTALGPNGNFADDNDNSLVLMVEYNGVKALFPGDQLTGAEAALLKSGRPVKCDVLKVGHHGQDDASSEAFLRAASPTICVIPTSSDPSDAPAPTVLQRMEAIGAKVSVIGHTGTLRFSSGTLAVEPVTPSAPPLGLIISEINVKTEYVEITNPTAVDVSLAGWSLLSGKGKQCYFFPAGFKLKSGGAVRIYSGMKEDKSLNGLFWTDKKIWRDKKENKASLIDPYGRVISTK